MRKLTIPARKLDTAIIELPRKSVATDLTFEMFYEQKIDHI